MTNIEKANEISRECSTPVRAALMMAKWKDDQLRILLDAIDHAYLQTDGTYGDLSYEVSDQVKHLKRQL